MSDPFELISIVGLMTACTISLILTINEACNRIIAELRKRKDNQ